MALGQLWAGRAHGTNTGNLFVKFEGEDSALKGTLRLMDPVHGLSIFEIAGTFDSEILIVTGQPVQLEDGVVAGALTATAKLQPDGNLEGEWETEIGTAGTFVLFPHASDTGKSQEDRLPDQLHTANLPLGPIEIDREQLIALAESLQQEFKSSVVITWIAGTEHSRFLRDFKNLRPSQDRAEVVKIRASDSDSSGVNRTVQIEFGPYVNSVMTQGADEAWVLGKREAYKRDLQRYERSYALNVKVLGAGPPDFIVLVTLAVLPSLATLHERSILLFAVFLLIGSVKRLHAKYLPHAAIFLTAKPTGLFAVIGPSIVSWVATVLAGTAATLLAAYMLGWMKWLSTE